MCVSVLHHKVKQFYMDYMFCVCVEDYRERRKTEERKQEKEEVEENN